MMLCLELTTVTDVITIRCEHVILSYAVVLFVDWTLITVSFIMSIF